ncbi:MAG TPA: response regulator transcription factor [Terriglobia bacterium]|nr:response regulator transcription factor [Terriglobia bacterium]
MDERILLVQDQPKPKAPLPDRLRRQGWTVHNVRDSREGTDLALNEAFDLIILDLTRATHKGIDVCRDLRQYGLNTPILILTARNQPADKIVGLKVGADDCVTKPFAMIELLARVEALLRRSKSNSWGHGTIHHFGQVRVDLRRTQVWRNGKTVPLSAREFQLLRYFIEHREATLSRPELLKEVWGFDPMTSTRTVDVHVAGLRQKLERDSKQPQLIRTIQGLGYKLVATPSAPNPAIT